MIDNNLDSTPPDPVPESAHSTGDETPLQGRRFRDELGDGRHRNVFDVLRDIKNGVLDTSNLTADDRRLCVAQLVGDGLSVGEIAQVLRVSTRTITRDRQAIHEQNAIEPDPRLGYLFAGRLAAEYEATSARIRRVTRDKETPPSVKIDGEYKCYDMFDRLVQRLQSTGLIPTAAQRVQSDLTHNLGDLSSMADLRNEVLRLETIEREAQGLSLPAAPAPMPATSTGTAPVSSPVAPKPVASASAPAVAAPSPAPTLAPQPPRPAPAAAPSPPASPPPPSQPKTAIQIYLEEEQKRREARR
ncbi:MAG: helix-turn-helix domain-containing protein [Vicinamibacterales bacterium]